MFTNASSPTRTPLKKNIWVWCYALAFVSIWISTFIGTTDINNWLLENTLVFLMMGFLIISFRWYQFSDLSYLLVTVFLCLHVYGAKYTYAENPLGYWLKDHLHWQRNQYDRIVHFSFGLLLAYAWREILIRWFKFPVGAAWVLPIICTLSISGTYELIEWAVADVFFKDQGPAYLGTQGDVWDSQKDMFMAALGALIATSIISIVMRIRGNR